MIRNIHPSVKKFFSYYKPYRRLFAADIACAVAVSVIGLIFPLCARYITGEVLAEGLEGAGRKILLTGAVMLGMVVITALCTYFYDAKGHAMGAMMERDMRAELFGHFQKLPFSFHDKQTPGSLLSRVTNDLLQLTELYHHGPEDLVIYLVKFIGALVILLLLNAPLALAIFCVLPVMAVFVVVYNKKLKKVFQVNLERIASVNNRVEENLSGIRVVQSFCNEDLEIERFSKENNSFLESRKTIYSTESVLYVGMEALSKLLTVMVLTLGGMWILGGAMELGDLVAFLLYVGYLVEPIPQLTRITQQYQEGIAGFRRFLEILHTEPDIQDKPEAVELGSCRGHVEFRRAGFHYGNGENVLQGVDLEIQPGETVALVGSSGVGKSTLCSLIPRFYDVTGGAVLVDGVDVRDAALESLRRNVGVVQQDVYLFPGSVLDNIRYGKPDATREEVEEAAKNADAHGFVLELPQGYDTEVGHRGVRLSGGQKQRISIARAFLKNPPVLVLDEATSSLDNESERIVRASVARLAAGRTTIIIAHRLSTIRGADRIVVVKDGGIAEQGSHQELLNRDGVYAGLYRAEDLGEGPWGSIPTSKVLG